MRRFSLPVCSLLILTLLAGKVLCAEERTWTSTDGKFKVVAELIGTEAGVVVLRRSDGKTARVPLERLSEDDRQYIASQSRDAAQEPTFECVVLRNVAPEAEPSKQGVLNALVPRELVRQALLIAAREDLGLRTCDESIREPLPKLPAEKLLTLHISVVPYNDGTLRVRLWKGAKAVGEPAWAKDYRYRVAAVEMYPSIIEQVGSASRQELVDVLKTMGCTAAPRPEAAHGATDPSAIEALLLGADVVPQFQAARMGHYELLAKPDSPEALATLSRAYANLSLLTTHYWSAANVAFLARSLLYADRLPQTGSAKPQSLLHRAYARAITGQLAAAIEDLEQAKQEVTTLPPWARLIEPYSKCQADELMKLADADAKLARIAEWLSFRIATNSRDEVVFSSTVKRMMENREMPLQAISYMNGALVLQRWAAEAGPELLQSTLEFYLPSLTDLPATILKDFDWKDVDSPYQGIAEVTRRFKTVSMEENGSEPSWGMLGSLIEDEEFVLILFAIFNAKNATKSSLAPFVDEVLPGIVDHPYAAYIESFGVDVAQEHDEYLRILEKLRVVDPQPHMQGLIRDMMPVATSHYANVGRYAQQHMGIEYTYQSMHFRADFGFPNVEAQREFADDLERISPNSAFLPKLRLRLADQPAGDELKAWEAKIWENPSALDTLGNKYLQQGQTDDAKRIYARAFETGPTIERCLVLSNLQFRTRDISAWQATLESYLTQEDTGLNLAQAHNALAVGFMSLGRWQDAEPHAVEAANTGAAWGLTTASRCYEGMQDWAKAEYYVRSAAEAYQGANYFEWYLWCRRTNHGALQEATAAVRDYLRTNNNPGDLGRIGFQAIFDELEGDLPAAIRSYQAATKARASLWMTLPLAIIAKEQQDEAALSSAVDFLRQVSTSETLARSKHRMQLAAFAVSVLAPPDGQPPELDLKEVAQLIETAPNAETRVDVRYFVGCLLNLNGQTDEAVKQWREAVKTGPITRPNCTLAAVRLRRVTAAKKD